MTVILRDKKTSWRVTDLESRKASFSFSRHPESHFSLRELPFEHAARPLSHCDNGAFALRQSLSGNAIKPLSQRERASIAPPRRQIRGRKNHFSA
jgi:hypothetical protein